MINQTGIREKSILHIEWLPLTLFTIIILILIGIIAFLYNKQRKHKCQTLASKSKYLKTEENTKKLKYRNSSSGSSFPLRNKSEVVPDNSGHTKKIVRKLDRIQKSSPPGRLNFGLPGLRDSWNYSSKIPRNIPKIQAKYRPTLTTELSAIPSSQSTTSLFVQNNNNKNNKPGESNFLDDSKSLCLDVRIPMVKSNLSKPPIPGYSRSRSRSKKRY